MNLCGCREGAGDTNGGMESERTSGQGERGVATEKRSPGENERDRETGECDEEVNDATVRARMTEGTTLQGSDEDGQRRSRRGTSERSGRRRGWPITCVGWQGDATGTEARRMRGGRGNARSCPDNPSSSLSRRCPDRPRLARSASRPFPRPFVGLRAFLLPPLCPSRSRSRSRARSIEGVRALSLSQRRGDAPASLADHGRVRTIQGPAGARSYSFRGAQYLGDRQCK